MIGVISEVYITTAEKFKINWTNTTTTVKSEESNKCIVNIWVRVWLFFSLVAYQHSNQSRNWYLLFGLFICIRFLFYGTWFSESRTTWKSQRVLDDRPISSRYVSVKSVKYDMNSTARPTFFIIIWKIWWFESDPSNRMKELLNNLYNSFYFMSSYVWGSKLSTE